MTDKPPEKCIDCRFFDSSTFLNEGENTGLCRVRAPRIDKTTGRAMWPFVEDDDWCRKFYRRLSND